LREKPAEKRIWKDEEIEIVLDNAKPWARDAFYILASTGARRGEITSLTWGMVNFEFRTIEIHSTKGTGVDRVRYVPMTDALLDFLSTKKEQAKRTLKYREDYPVFLNANGNPISPTHLSREMSRLCKKLKLTGLTLHGFRHTWITKMVSSKVGLATTMKLAGHANLKTTQGYLHISDEELQEAMVAGSKARLIRLK
jgi:integrase